MTSSASRRIAVVTGAVALVTLGACGSTKTATTPAATTVAAATATTVATPATTAAMAMGGELKNFTPDPGAKPIDCKPAAGAPLKAAWVYVGPINDGGWTQAHDAGRKFVESKLGAKVQTTYKENVPEGPQVAQVIEDLVKDGNKVIIGTSFGFQDAFVEEAGKHPDVCFEFATGYKTAGNLSQFYGAGEDTDYLAGMAAGSASKSGKLGFVAPFPIPEVIREINSWTLGAQATHPGATVQLVFTNTWFDPAKERAAAESLIAAGVDAIGSGQDSPASGEAAKAKGLPWAGYDADQSANFPDIWLTATNYNWGPYEAARIEAAMAGTWTAGNYYGNLGDGFVTLAPYGKLVTADAKTKIDAKKADLTAKPSSQFTGPIKDQTGKVRIEAGKPIAFGDLMGMNYLVEGVVGQLPAS